MEATEFYLMITGPKQYLPESKYEKHVITQDEIEESREDGESDQEVIDYFIEEEIAAWEQRWCTAVVISKKEYDKLTTSIIKCD